MVLNNDEKAILLLSLSTEMARLKRAINAEPNQQIKEILSARHGATMAIAGRVSNEVTK